MSYKLPWNCELTTCQLGFSRYDSKGETQKGYIKKEEEKMWVYLVLTESFWRCSACSMVMYIQFAFRNQFRGI